MPASAFSLRASLWQTLIRTKRSDAPWWVVLRNTVAVVLPLAAGLASGALAAGLGVSVGALLTMFSDQPGPYRQRTLRLLLASCAAALAALLGFSVGAALAPLLLVTLLVAFCCGMLVALGVDAARVGMSAIIVLIITVASPATLVDAAQGAGAMFCGGLLLGMLSIAAWPLQRYRPERATLAEVYRGLAALAREGAPSDTGGAPALSDAMNALQHAISGPHRARGRAMEAFSVLLELGERMRLELVALGELGELEHDGGPGDFSNGAATVLGHIADALDSGDAPTAARHAMAAIDPAVHPTLSPQAALHQQALRGQLAAAVRNANWAGSRGELRAAAAEITLPVRLRSESGLATLRANLSFESAAFRHALRWALAITLATLISRLLHLPHGYWLPMTVAIVLRPDFSTTISFGLLRVTGTLAGLLLTTALLMLLPNQSWVHLAMLGVLCMAFRRLASVNYGLAVAALTGLVVILLSFEGIASATALFDRSLNTVLGSALALSAYLLWPTWERSRAPVTLAGLLEAYASYLQVLAPAARPERQRDARVAVRRARTNAQASVVRLRGEPGSPPALVLQCEALLTHSNRLARTAMALEAVLAGGSPPEPEALAHHLQRCAAVLDALGTSLRQPDQFPAGHTDLRSLQRSLAQLLSLAEDSDRAAALNELCDRLVDNIDTLAHIIARAPAPSTAPVSRNALRR